MELRGRYAVWATLRPETVAAYARGDRVAARAAVAAWNAKVLAKRVSPDGYEALRGCGRTDDRARRNRRRRAWRGAAAAPARAHGSDYTVPFFVDLGQRNATFVSAMGAAAARHLLGRRVRAPARARLRHRARGQLAAAPVAPPLRADVRGLPAARAGGPLRRLAGARACIVTLCSPRCVALIAPSEYALRQFRWQAATSPAATRWRRSWSCCYPAIAPRRSEPKAAPRRRRCGSRSSGATSCTRAARRRSARARAPARARRAGRDDRRLGSCAGGPTTPTSARRRQALVAREHGEPRADTRRRAPPSAAERRSAAADGARPTSSSSRRCTTRSATSPWRRSRARRRCSRRRVERAAGGRRGRPQRLPAAARARRRAGPLGVVVPHAEPGYLDAYEHGDAATLADTIADRLSASGSRPSDYAAAQRRRARAHRRTASTSTPRASGSSSSTSACRERLPRTLRRPPLGEHRVVDGAQPLRPALGGELPLEARRGRRRRAARAARASSSSAREPLGHASAVGGARQQQPAVAVGSTISGIPPTALATTGTAAAAASSSAVGKASIAGRVQQHVAGAQHRHHVVAVAGHHGRVAERRRQRLDLLARGSVAGDQQPQLREALAQRARRRRSRRRGPFPGRSTVTIIATSASGAIPSSARSAAGAVARRGARSRCGPSRRALGVPAGREVGARGPRRRRRSRVRCRAAAHAPRAAPCARRRGPRRPDGRSGGRRSGGSSRPAGSPSERAASVPCTSASPRCVWTTSGAHCREVPPQARQRARLAPGAAPGTCTGSTPLAPQAGRCGVAVAPRS